MPTITELIRALPEEAGGGEFDFGNETNFRRGVELFSQIVAKRYSRSTVQNAAVIPFGVFCESIGAFC
jgi:hypothetical protein